MTSRRVSAPAVSPVTVGEAKTHLRVDASDEDELISGLIDAAVSHIDADGTLGRAIITQTWAEWFGYSPYWLRLSIGGFQSLVSVEYYDENNELQTALLSDFETRMVGDFVAVGPKMNAQWPSVYSRSDAIKVTYIAGYGDAASDVPASIKQAILLLVGHWYENRTAVSEVSLKEVPMAVDALIGNERVGWYG